MFPGVLTDDIDILCLTETHLDPSVPDEDIFVLIILVKSLEEIGTCLVVVLLSMRQ